jgi:hypothetical protein
MAIQYHLWKYSHLEPVRKFKYTDKNKKSLHPLFKFNDFNDNRKSSNQSNGNTDSSKLLLFWDKDIDLIGNSSVLKCPNRRCLITTNRSAITSSDMVIFSLQALLKSSSFNGVLPKPNQRKDQKWLLYSDAPDELYRYGNKSLQLYNGVFNAVVSTGRSADLSLSSAVVTRVNTIENGHQQLRHHVNNAKTNRSQKYMAVLYISPECQHLAKIDNYLR